LARLGCSLFEEPLPRYAHERLAELNRKVEIPIAGGENNPYLHEFATMVKNGIYDILQPDALVCGGLTVLQKIAALAESFEMQVIPHHARGQLGAIAQLHLIATWRHSPYLEILHDPPVADYRNNMAIFKDPPRVDPDGTVAVPQSPGIGLEIDPDLVES
jgi:L-alanine-DL-glutamate epimerase-like enolase superfamily enzyme